MSALPPAPVTRISNGSVIKGTIVSKDQLVIDGKVEGSVSATNHVIVGKTGQVYSNFDVDSLQVFGKIVGDVVSKDRVSIESTGSIEGNIISPKLAISEGAVFRGNIDMSNKVKAQKPANEAQPNVYQQKTAE